jgi:tetratricopeptide (TPR) repeat protein
MADETPSALKARYFAIDQRLDAGLQESERATVKQEIVLLFRNVEQQLAELTQMKDDIKLLVDKWKTQQAAATASLAPQFAEARPVVQADHIGASTFIEKGWSRLSLGDFEGAETALMRAIELSPNDPASESLLGWAQMLQEKFEPALANFQKVLMREPANSLARVNVGYICLKRRTFTDAIEHLSKAIRLDNDKKASLYAHFYLGLVYLEREMYEDAENFFLKTLALGPNLIEAYYELGWAYWLNAQRDEASDAWGRGFAANKFNPWGKRCAEVLKVVADGGEPVRA